MNFIEKKFNSNGLKENDIDEITTRARALLINLNNEILMCYSNGLSHFEFPGGHLEKNETLEECLIREILEETGIDISTENKIPFYNIKYYCKNYKNSNKNRLVQIYYYIVYTDKEYDPIKRNLVESEIDQNYECKYIPFEILKGVLTDNLETTKEKNTALYDMIRVCNEYSKIKDMLKIECEGGIKCGRL